MIDYFVVKSVQVEDLLVYLSELRVFELDIVDKGRSDLTSLFMVDRAKNHYFNFPEEGEVIDVRHVLEVAHDF